MTMKPRFYKKSLLLGFLLGLVLFFLKTRSAQNSLTSTKASTAPLSQQNPISEEPAPPDLSIYLDRQAWLDHPHELLHDLLALCPDELILHSDLTAICQVIHETNPGIASELCLRIPDRLLRHCKPIWNDAVIWPQNQNKKEELLKKFAISPLVFLDRMNGGLSHERDWEFFISQPTHDVNKACNIAILLNMGTHDPLNPRQNELIKKLSEKKILVDNFMVDHGQIFDAAKIKYDDWNSLPKNSNITYALMNLIPKENLPSSDKPIETMQAASIANNFNHYPKYSEKVLDFIIDFYQKNELLVKPEEIKEPIPMEAYDSFKMSHSTDDLIRNSYESIKELMEQAKAKSSDPEKFQKAEKNILHHWTQINPYEASLYARNLPMSSISTDQAHAFFLASLDHPEVAEKWIHPDMTAEQKQKCLTLLERSKKK
jgi:hypothetical protein